jgi:predicted alpha/beta superfamily hydrolase
VLDGSRSLVIGHQLTLHSDLLDEDRDLLIFVPSDHETNPQPLPVVYLLDGRYNFRHTTAAVDLLVSQDLMPRSMVVGVANVDRGRDFTDHPVDEGSSGGADRFLDFVESELIPFVDSNFNTAPHRILIGHSLGGLLVLHGIAERPHLFAAAIAISPAITNDERVPDGVRPLTRRLGQRLGSWGGRDFSLYITMSEGEQGVWVEDLDVLIEVLNVNAPENFHWIHRDMAGEDHRTTVYRSTFDGLRWIHTDWDVGDLLRRGTMTEVTDHFQRNTRRLGFMIQPPEDLLNLVGYRLLEEGRGDDAIAALSTAVGLYPDSANVYDSLGEALERQGMLPGAMSNYRRAVITAEANGDRRLPIFRANLERVEALLLERGGVGGRILGEDPRQAPGEGSSGP